jgi:hypothetical protein
MDISHIDRQGDAEQAVVAMEERKILGRLPA